MSQEEKITEISKQELEDELNDIAGGAQKTSKSCWIFGGRDWWPENMPEDVKVAILTEAAQAGSTKAAGKIIKKRLRKWMLTYGTFDTNTWYLSIGTVKSGAPASLLNCEYIKDLK